MESTSAGRRPLILIVDDDVTLRDFARVTLEAAGFAVVEAACGEDALRMAAEHRPQLILMDVIMPGLNGFEATALLRDRPEFELVPILILTAFEDVDSVQRAYDAGATDFMAKPVNWLILAQRVRYLIRANELLEREKELLGQLQQAQKLEVVATLTSGVAHDFNNVLQTIMMLAQLAQEKMGSQVGGYDELSQALDVVRRGGELVHQLLDYGKKSEVNSVAVDPNDQIRAAHRLLQRTIASNLRIQLDLDESVPTIRFDSVQLEQVLMNLAINARDAMPGGGELTFATRSILVDGEQMVSISVKDSGEGMSSDTLGRIFEPFFSTKGASGTGLGLAMVRRLVEKHGGRVSCQSQTGSGTRFDILLPPASKDALVGCGRGDATDLLDASRFAAG